MSFSCNDKSIMFLCGRFGIGGTEKVTVTMANQFVANGWSVCVAIFEMEQNNFASQLDKRVNVRALSFPVYRLANVKKLASIMREFNVHYIINQWAVPFPVSLMLFLARPHGAKLINFFHTMPGFNKRLFESRGFKRRLISVAMELNFRWVYRCSDAYVVLAECYEPLFRSIAGIRTSKKLTHIPNPFITRQVEAPRENVILYVGRLALTEKRVDRVIETWRLLANDLPDWRLEIVGDGPDRAQLEEMSAELPRVEFLGFKEPSEYYAKSKILILTSEVEGFALVVVEAMAYGCVPVVLGSFPVVRELVQKDCGVVVDAPWDARRFADAVASVASDTAQWINMSEACPTAASRYSPENVFRLYLDLLERL